MPTASDLSGSSVDGECRGEQCSVWLQLTRTTRIVSLCWFCLVIPLTVEDLKDIFSDSASHAIIANRLKLLSQELVNR